MTMFQNWSTKDEIETSIRTFHISTGTKLKTHFLKLNEEVTKMGGKTYSILFCGWYIIMKLHQNKMVFRGGSRISNRGGGGGNKRFGHAAPIGGSSRHFDAFPCYLSLISKHSDIHIWIKMVDLDGARACCAPPGSATGIVRYTGGVACWYHDYKIV